MKNKQIKNDLIESEINLQVLIAEKKENKKQTVRLKRRIEKLKFNLEIKECGHYIQYADGTIGKIGHPKIFTYLFSQSTPLESSELPRRKVDKYQVCTELASTSINRHSDLIIQYDKLEKYMNEEKVPSMLNEAVTVSYRCHVSLDYVVNNIIQVVKIFSKSTS